MDVPAFSIAVVRVSKSEGTRLLGWVGVGQGEVLALTEGKQRMYYPFLSFPLAPCNPAAELSFDLVKVNPDGPSIKISFTVSLSSSASHPISYQGDSVENQSKPT
jgi:hypothetical protein